MKSEISFKPTGGTRVILHKVPHICLYILTFVHKVLENTYLVLKAKVKKIMKFFFQMSFIVC